MNTQLLESLAEDTLTDVLNRYRSAMIEENPGFDFNFYIQHRTLNLILAVRRPRGEETNAQKDLNYCYHSSSLFRDMISKIEDECSPKLVSWKEMRGGVHGTISIVSYLGEKGKICEGAASDVVNTIIERYEDAIYWAEPNFILTTKVERGLAILNLSVDYIVPLHVSNLEFLQECIKETPLLGDFIERLEEECSPHKFGWHRADNREGIYGNLNVTSLVKEDSSEEDSGDIDALHAVAKKKGFNPDHVHFSENGTNDFSIKYDASNGDFQHVIIRFREPNSDDIFEVTIRSFVNGAPDNVMELIPSRLRFMFSPVHRGFGGFVDFEDCVLLLNAIKKEFTQESMVLGESSQPIDPRKELEKVHDFATKKGMAVNQIVKSQKDGSWKFDAAQSLDSKNTKWIENWVNFQQPNEDGIFKVMLISGKPSETWRLLPVLPSRSPMMFREVKGKSYAEGFLDLEDCLDLISSLRGYLYEGGSHLLEADLDPAEAKKQLESIRSLAKRKGLSVTRINREESDAYLTFDVDLVSETGVLGVSSWFRVQEPNSDGISEVTLNGNDNVNVEESYNSLPSHISNLFKKVSLDHSGWEPFYEAHLDMEDLENLFSAIQKMGRNAPLKEVLGPPISLPSLRNALTRSGVSNFVRVYSFKGEKRPLALEYNVSDDSSHQLNYQYIKIYHPNADSIYPVEIESQLLFDTLSPSLAFYFKPGDSPNTHLAYLDSEEIINLTKSLKPFAHESLSNSPLQESIIEDTIDSMVKRYKETIDDEDPTNFISFGWRGPTLELRYYHENGAMGELIEEIEEACNNRFVRRNSIPINGKVITYASIYADEILRESASTEAPILLHQLRKSVMRKGWKSKDVTKLLAPSYGENDTFSFGVDVVTALGLIDTVWLKFNGPNSDGIFDVRLAGYKKEKVEPFFNALPSRLRAMLSEYSTSHDSGFMGPLDFEDSLLLTSVLYNFLHHESH